MTRIIGDNIALTIQIGITISNLHLTTSIRPPSPNLNPMLLGKCLLASRAIWVWHYNIIYYYYMVIILIHIQYSSEITAYRPRVLCSARNRKWCNFLISFCPQYAVTDMARVSYTYWIAEPSIRTNRVQRIFVLGQTSAGANADARHRHRSKPHTEEM